MARITRRELLKSTAAAAALTIVASRSSMTYAANDTVNIGIVGAGGQGGVNRKWLKGDGANIVALCDVDSKAVEKALPDHPGAKTYSDFRKMLETQKEIDGIMVSTADHCHAVISVTAMKLGKAVCTEKPLTHSIWEARQLAEAARKYKVATQHDNENHAESGVRRLVEAVQAGSIGTVKEVYIWSDRPIWPQGVTKRPPTKPVPANLNWDVWLGPAPFREYHDGLHPFSWRGYWDFGTGALGDMGCHFWDSAVWSMKLSEAKTIGVEAEQEGNSDETGPHWSIVTFKFGPRGDLPPITVKWLDGRKPTKAADGSVKYNIPNLPPRPEELEPDRKMPSNGSMFVGDKGTILVSDATSWRIVPEEKMKAFKKPEQTLPTSPGHKKEWLQAIKGGPPAMSNFAEWGGPLAELVLLGNLAVRTGERFEWDPVNLKAKNCPKADQYVRREYRKGWEL
jgi:predicted dehydrogenase